MERARPSMRSAVPFATATTAREFLRPSNAHRFERSYDCGADYRSHSPWQGAHAANARASRARSRSTFALPGNDCGAADPGTGGGAVYLHRLSQVPRSGRIPGDCAAVGTLNAIDLKTGKYLGKFHWASTRPCPQRDEEYGNRELWRADCDGRRGAVHWGHGV